MKCIYSTSLLRYKREYELNRYRHNPRRQNSKLKMILEWNSRPLSVWKGVLCLRWPRELSPGWGDIGNENCIKKTMTRNQRTQVSKYCFSHLWTVKAHTLIWAASTPTAMISQFLWLGLVQPFPCWGLIRPNSRLSWATDSSGSLCLLGWY